VGRGAGTICRHGVTENVEKRRAGQAWLPRALNQ
jgi:hypothetical protein